MSTVDLPPNTTLSAASALIIRLLLGSCSLFFLMWAHSRLVTSVRGIGFEPTTSASAALGVTGFMKAALAFRAGFFFVVFVLLVLFVVLGIESPFQYAFTFGSTLGRTHLIPQGPRSNNSSIENSSKIFFTRGSGF